MPSVNLLVGTVGEGKQLIDKDKTYSCSNAEGVSKIFIMAIMREL